MGDVAALTQDSLFWPGATLSELLLQHCLRIIGLAHIQAVLAAFLSPVEVPVRTPLCSGLGVGPVLELEDAPAVVPALNDAALLNKLLTALRTLSSSGPLKWAMAAMISSGVKRELLYRCVYT